MNREGEPSGIPGFPGVLQALAGYAVKPGAEPAQVVVRLTPPRVVEEVAFTAYRLTFSVAGTSHTQVFSQGAHICFRSVSHPCASGSPAAN
jgi:hypothetical protein